MWVHFFMFSVFWTYPRNTLLGIMLTTGLWQDKNSGLLRTHTLHAHPPSWPSNPYVPWLWMLDENGDWTINIPEDTTLPDIQSKHLPCEVCFWPFMTLLTGQLREVTGNGMKERGEWHLAEGYRSVSSSGQLQRGQGLSLHENCVLPTELLGCLACRAPDCDKIGVFCDKNLRQCYQILYFVAHVRPVNLPVFFFFLTPVVEGTQSKSKNLESGLTGGRPMCVRWAGTGTVID